MATGAPPRVPMQDSPYTLDFYEDRTGEYRWRITHSNGEIVGASSEGFVTEHGARANLEALRSALQWNTHPAPA